MSQSQFVHHKSVAAIAIALSLLTPCIAIAADNEHEQERVKESGNVMKELLDSPSGVPISILNKSECVIVLPSVKKAGFLVAGQYGRGVMTCRSGENFNGKWSAPTMMQSSGGSFGLQAGGQATDFVVLVMNDKGARALLKGKAKLGADASVAAGPVGRDAEASTNAAMSAEMLSYSRAQGVFAGVSLSGTSLGPDGGANEKIYGKKVSATEIVEGKAGSPPESAQKLLAVLSEKSPKNVSSGNGNTYLCGAEVSQDMDLEWAQGKEVPVRAKGKVLELKRANGKIVRLSIVKTVKTQ